MPLDVANEVVGETDKAGDCDGEGSIDEDGVKVK